VLVLWIYVSEQLFVLDIGGCFCRPVQCVGATFAAATSLCVCLSR